MSPAAARRLRGLISGEHPDLLTEWLAAAVARGLRLPPQLLPALLDRMRRGRPADPGLPRLLAEAGGPRARWLVLPVPESAEQEVEIVTRRVAQLGRSIGLPETTPGAEEIRRVVTVFRELRQGVTEDGRSKVKSPSGTLSPAEAISVITSGLALAAHFGDGMLRAADVAGGLTGAVIQDPVSDRVAWQEYLETVVRERDDWSDFYRACREVAG